MNCDITVCVSTNKCT